MTHCTEPIASEGFRPGFLYPHGPVTTAGRGAAWSPAPELGFKRALTAVRGQISWGTGFTTASHGAGKQR